MWGKIKNWFAPKVKKVTGLYVEHHELIEKGVKPAVKQAVSMGLVDKDKEDKLIEQIEKGMEKVAEQLEKKDVTTATT